MLDLAPGFSIGVSKRIGVAQIVALAQEAERLGYRSIWIPETWGTDAGTVLAVLARETERIALAAGIFNVYSRSATLIAQIAASLQDLSNGRFVLGLGASGPRVVEDWHGIPYGSPLQRTRDYVNVIRLALAGETVTYHGPTFHLQRFRLQNPPQQPVPIFLAALGPRNVRLAGEICDGWLPIFAPAGHLAPLFAELRAGEAGAQRSGVVVAAYLPVALGEDGDRALRQQLAYYVGGMGTFYATYLSRLGFAVEVERIREAWQRGERLAAVHAVSNDLVALCTLGSDSQTVRERLQTYHRQGIDVPILSLPHSLGPEEAQETLRGLANTFPPL